MAGWPPTAALLDRWRIPLYVIHSRDDEVVPLGPTERSARQLHVRGATVQMVTLEGISHFETHRFVPHLTAAVPWIEQIWADADRMPDKEEGSAC
jgi:dipeptidyl aminopeptidase/acylaminoacyl peptidase